MPHAYKAGSQTQLLKAQIEAMPEGGTYCMVAPPNPFRCPPGPYERISMVAHVLKQSNPTAKIIIVDPKEKFSKQGLFQEGWQRHYPGMIERIGPDFGGDKVEVRPESMEVVVDGEAMKVDVCNVIPGQQAGRIAAVAGITNEAGWAPIVPHTMQSRADENIHVLGDASQQGDMPKSGFSANSQAKACAMAVRGRAHRLLDLPAALLQHVLVPHRHRRRRQGRCVLRSDRREDRQGRRLHFPDRGKRGAAQGDLRGVARLVRRHLRRHVQLELIGGVQLYAARESPTSPQHFSLSGAEPAYRPAPSAFPRRISGGPWVAFFLLSLRSGRGSVAL